MGTQLTPRTKSEPVIPFRPDLDSRMWVSDRRETISEVSWRSGESPPIRIERRDGLAAVQKGKAIITFWVLKT